MDVCDNCGAKITEGGVFAASNLRYGAAQLAIVNFVNEAAYDEICQKCGNDLVSGAIAKLHNEARQRRNYVAGHITDFPMMTVASLPAGGRYRIKGMVTANVTVGTGLFSEFSQGFSDMFGLTNSETGMAFKVNNGEAAARAILVRKAMGMGANCILGVDIDYGVTANNAATVNMQGTAVAVANLEDVLDAPEYARAQEIAIAYSRVDELARWLKGDFTSVAG